MPVHWERLFEFGDRHLYSWGHLICNSWPLPLYDIMGCMIFWWFFISFGFWHLYLTPFSFLLSPILIAGCLLFFLYYLRIITSPNQTLKSVSHLQMIRNSNSVWSYSAVYSYCSFRSVGLIAADTTHTWSTLTWQNRCTTC